MVLKKILIISLISCCFSSCLNYYHHRNGGYRPKKAKFTLSKSPYQLKKDDSIDTNSVYINVSEIEFGDEVRKTKHFLRFFSNGRYIRGVEDYSKQVMNKDLFNTFNKPGFVIGYYNVNNNVITTEHFYVKRIEGGFYNKNKGFIKNDSIFIFFNSFKNKEFPIPTKKNCRIYVRKKIEGLTRTPDW